MRETKNIYNIIDSLNVSNGWKNVFKKIQVSYYNNFYQGKSNNIHLWRYNQSIMGLGPSDRFKFFTRFNFYALIFGPLYYIFKLMLTKGLFLLLIEAAIVYFYGFPVAWLAGLIHIYTAIFATTDYFSKLVLNHPYVKDNPEILSDLVDENFTKSVIKEDSPYAVFTITALVASVLFIWFVTTSILDNIKYEKIANKAFAVCASHNECVRAAELAVADIKRNKPPLHKEYYRLAEAYYGLGDNQNALKALNEAIRQKRTSVYPYLLKGNILADLGQYANARLTYETLLKYHPGGKFIYYPLGSAYYKENNYIKAKECFEKAVRAYPKNPVYREALAYAKIYLRDTEGAKQELQKVIQILKTQGEGKNAAKIESLEGYMKNLK